MKKKVKVVAVEKQKGNRIDLGLRRRNEIMSRVSRAIGYGLRISA